MSRINAVMKLPAWPHVVTAVGASYFLVAIAVCLYLFGKVSGLCWNLSALLLPLFCCSFVAVYVFVRPSRPIKLTFCAINLNVSVAFRFKSFACFHDCILIVICVILQSLVSLNRKRRHFFVGEWASNLTRNRSFRTQTRFYGSANTEA